MSAHEVRRESLRAAILGFASCCMACDATSPDMSHVGSYELATVNGAPLPQDYGSPQRRITGARLTLNADTSFCDSLAFAFTTGATSAEVGFGFAPRRDDRITLVYFVSDQEPDTLVYSRRDRTLTEKKRWGQVLLWRRSEIAWPCPR